MLRLADEQTTPPAEKSDAEIMAEALPHLRRLSHVSDLPGASRLAAELLAQTVERRQPLPALRPAPPDGQSDRGGA